MTQGEQEQNIQDDDIFAAPKNMCTDTLRTQIPIQGQEDKRGFSFMYSAFP